MEAIDPLNITLHPVGFVSSSIKDVSLKAGKDGLRPEESLKNHRKYRQMVEENICTITVSEEYQELLDGIEEFSHALILYWPHLLDEERRTLKKVHPMGRKDLPLTGIFATRSPARPNPVLISVVRVLAREKNELMVKGFEAVDGSPVLDIKPHMKAYDTEDKVKVASWLEQIEREVGE